MKKLSRNKNLKIISATSVTLFSLLTVFSATFAWFSMNKETTNCGQQISVDPASGYFYKLTIHNAVGISNSLYQFNTKPWGTIQLKDWRTKEFETTFSSDSCFMGSYDVLEKVHPVLFLFQLGDNSVESCTATSDKPITIKASTDTDYYVGDDNQTTPRTIYPTEEQNVDVDNGYFNPLSSIVKYSCTTFASNTALNEVITEDSISETDSDGVLHVYDTYDIPTNTLSYNGVSGSYGSFVKFKTDDSYASFDKEPVIYSSDSATIKYIAVVFDYYELAVDVIYSVFLGNYALEEPLEFTCDWTMVL